MSIHIFIKANIWLAHQRPVKTGHYYSQHDGDYQIISVKMWKFKTCLGSNNLISTIFSNTLLHIFTYCWHKNKQEGKHTASTNICETSQTLMSAIQSLIACSRLMFTNSQVFETVDCSILSRQIVWASISVQPDGHVSGSLGSQNTPGHTINTILDSLQTHWQTQNMCLCQFMDEIVGKLCYQVRSFYSAIYLV